MAFHKSMVLPSLKLAVRTWNTGVGRWFSWGPFLVAGASYLRNVFPLSCCWISPQRLFRSTRFTRSVITKLTDGFFLGIYCSYLGSECFHPPKQLEKSPTRLMKPTWSNKLSLLKASFPSPRGLADTRGVADADVAIRGSCPDDLLGEPKLRKHVGMDPVVPTVKAKQIWREHTHNRKGVNIYCMFTSGEKKHLTELF